MLVMLADLSFDIVFAFVKTSKNALDYAIKYALNNQKGYNSKKIVIIGCRGFGFYITSRVQCCVHFFKVKALLLQFF